MKRVAKILGILLALVVVLIAGVVIYFYTAYPKVDAPKKITVTATPARLARGKYLVEHVVGCVDCHSIRDWKYYAGPVVEGSFGKGGQVFDEAMGVPGSLHAPNITPAGIGNLTDGELIRTITSGVTKDGRVLFPLMPYPAFNRLTTEDLHAVVAYIRTLPAVQNVVSPSSVNFPVSMFIRAAPRNAEPSPQPDTSNSVAYGKYLITISACGDCHTQMDKGEPKKGMEYAGGFAFGFPDGNVVHSANITPDMETGIGNWSKEMFLAKFAAYRAPEAKTMPVSNGMNTVMPWFPLSGMSDRDLGAIYDYLRTVKPVNNRVEKYSRAH
jgi:mono/diheme cytochrome c family protein